MVLSKMGKKSRMGCDKRCELHLGVILSPVAGYYCYVVAPEVEAVGTKTHGFHATFTRENKL